jgi:hypothetical protein
MRGVTRREGDKAWKVQHATSPPPSTPLEKGVMLFNNILPLSVQLSKRGKNKIGASGSLMYFVLCVEKLNCEGRNDFLCDGKTRHLT